MSSLFRRCGCRDNGGKTYGTLPEQPTEAQRSRACPAMLQDPKHGRWSFRLSAGFDPSTGRRRQVNGGTFDTKREAQQARNAAAVKLDQGKYVTPTRETLAEYLQRWLVRRSRVGPKGGKPLAASTLENYRRYADQDIIPSRLATLKLRDVRRSHVQAFVDDLVEAGRGAVTVRRIVAVLQGCLSSAVRDELISETPARLLDLPAVESEDFEPWEPDQVGHFLDVATTHRLGAFFELAVWTGLRRAELVELAWTDVDLPGRVVRVRKSKTEAGVRRVPLSDHAAGVLIAWQIKQTGERDAWGASYDDSGRVFTMEDGRALKLQYATRLFEKLRVEAQLPPMTLHGLRHQAASLYLASGSDIEFVSKLLGHSDVRVTSSVYSHLLQSTGRERAEHATALVPRKGPARTLHAQGGDHAEEAAPDHVGNRL